MPEETKPLTPNEFVEQMRQIESSTQGDPEDTHVQADELMVKVLRSLGYGEGIDVFNEMELWYA